MLKYDFKTVDTIGDEYELLALSFDGTEPHFTKEAVNQTIDSEKLIIYYGMQCPYIPNCITEVESYCKENDILLDLIKVDTLEKAKAVAGVFNNCAVFYKGKFETPHLLNKDYLKKII
jgi:hypothetical protein